MSTGLRRQEASLDGERPTATPPISPDACEELLSRTRHLRRAQHEIREAWLAGLMLDGKEEALFELEVLLKGVACFANPRNHPGPPRHTPVASVDFAPHLAYWRAAAARISGLARHLLGPRDATALPRRYLETLLPEDLASASDDLITSGSPDQSLSALRHAFTQTLEVADGLLQLSRVPFRLFYALLATAQREIAKNAYFNPLVALEFRPEFDRVASPAIRTLIAQMPGGRARRLVALAFLSLFRMLRYVGLVEQILAANPDATRQQCGRVYLVLSVLRSDARALTGLLRKRSGSLLAEGFEEELFATPASQIRERQDELMARGCHLMSIKAALSGVASRIRMEMRRILEHDIPNPDAGESDEEIRQGARRACVELRPALENTILFLGRALGSGFAEDGLFQATAKRETSERLRRDVWMFTQILRAFGTKTAHARASDDRWSSAAGFAFVREFRAYFQAIGYPLLRAAEYSRADRFVAAVSALSDVDRLDPARLETAVVEAKAFHDFLLVLFDEISSRDELRGIAFDRRAAAEALKRYLGH